MNHLELLTLIEVATKLKASKYTVENWHYGRRAPPPGFPPPIELGTALRWRSTDIDAFIAGLAYSNFGCIKPTDSQLSAIRKVATSPFVPAPLRGRGRPRKTAVEFKGGAHE